MPVVLFILAVMWAIYFASWYRSRAERRGVNSITAFNRHLSVLERTSPVGVAATDGSHRDYGYDEYGHDDYGHDEYGHDEYGHDEYYDEPEVVGFGSGRSAVGRPLTTAPRLSLDDARRRRRTVLLALAGAAVAGLVLVPFLGTVAVVFQIVADLLLVGYVAVLWRTQRLAAERRAKVRYLPQAPATLDRTLVLSRSAN